MNDKIRSIIQKNRIKHYEVAAEIGISEYTLSRWLRYPLTDEQLTKIFLSVQRIKEREAKTNETVSVDQ